MPVYRTGPDVSLDDLIARVESDGEQIVQVLVAKTGGEFTVITRVPVNTTGRAWLPSNLGQTETRS